MRRFYAFAALIGLLLSGGCKIEISVPEGGVVQSTSGDYSCAPGDTCVVEVNDIFFDQEFVAIPDAGHAFLGWAKRDRGLCGGGSGPCRLATTGFEGNAALLAILDSEDRYFLQAVFIKADSYSPGADIPVGGVARAGCSVNGRLYVFGAGWETGARLDTTLEYNPTTDSWRRRADMPTPRAFATATAYGGECFVIGGGGGNGGSGSEAVVEAYNPRTNRWRSVAPLPEGRISASSVTVGKRIYVVGGSSLLGSFAAVSPSLFIYNPDRDRWSNGAELPIPLKRMGIGAIDGLIYTVAGADRLNQLQESNVVQRYNPAADRWGQLASLPAARSSVAVAATGGQLYVFGGFGPNPRANSSAYQYDPGRDRWQQIASLHTARGDALAAPLGGQIVITAGRAPDHDGAPITKTEIYTP